MKFKVGDAVRILEGTKMLGRSKLAMSRWCGKIGTINEIGNMPEYQVQFEEGGKWYFNEEDLEIAEEVIDLRKLLKQGYVVEHMDGDLSKVEMNANMETIISGEHRWFPIENLNEQLEYICYFTSDKDYVGKVKIKAIYGLSESNWTACKISREDRETIWKRENKTEIQIKLEELEKQQREIADKIAELRKEIK